MVLYIFVVVVKGLINIKTLDPTRPDSTHAVNPMTGYPETMSHLSIAVALTTKSP